MRYLLIFMLLVGLFMFGSRIFKDSPFGFGIHGEGPVKTETRSMRDFHAIRLNVGGEVEVSVADNYFVEVQAQENLLPVLKTEVEDGALRIYFSENVSNHRGLKFRISAPAFDRFSISGSGKITSMTPIRSEKMKAEVSGSGDIVLQEVEFDSTIASISGSGGIQLGGKSNVLKASIAGSGDIKAKQLTANELKVDIAGSGSVTCDVAQTLKANIAGSGDVFYSGQPTVDANVSGSGSVKKMAEQ
ncbi:MAG: DUF2807 domain-containing protein [Saprospiraceae bacterium]|nr:DUF2807 domain-containing protein [Saprospiraceae bacterium]